MSLSSSASHTLPESLLLPVREALENRDGGEVVVRHGSHIGRVFVCHGKIAWVACNSIPERLQDILVAEAGLSKTDIKAVLLECKRVGLTFAETVLGWGLADHATLNHCLLLHNARHFHGIASLGENLSAMFVPQPLRYSSDFLYTLDQVLAAYDGLTKTVVESTRDTVGPTMSLEEVAREIPGTEFLAVARFDNCNLVGRWPADVEPEELRGALPGIRDQLVNPHSIAVLGERLVPRRPAGGVLDSPPVTVLLGGDTLLLARMVTSEYFAIMHCEGRENIGRILRIGLHSLEEVFERVGSES